MFAKVTPAPFGESVLTTELVDEAKLLLPRTGNGSDELSLLMVS